MNKGNFMKEKEQGNGQRCNKCNVIVYLINVEDELHNRCKGNLYHKWGRDVTFQVTS